MKFVGVREAQQNLSGLVENSQKERVVLTRHGQPVAVLTGLAGRDLEEALLGQDAAFRALIAERRRYRGPLLSHDVLRARAERELEKSKPRRRKRK
ncbi:MAG: type II toxin-antitoxin system prevent-host-death family antitoxin [Myxococcota bacterium]